MSSRKQPPSKKNTPKPTTSTPIPKPSNSRGAGGSVSAAGGTGTVPKLKSALHPLSAKQSRANPLNVAARVGDTATTTSRGAGSSVSAAGSTGTAPKPKPALDPLSSAKQRSNYLNVSARGGTNNNTTVQKNMRGRINTSRASGSARRGAQNGGDSSTDPELLEMKHEFAYNAYLRALLRQQIADRTIEKHKRSMNDQLRTQNAITYEMQSKVDKVKADIASIETSTRIEEMLEVLQKNFEKFATLADEHDLMSESQQLVEGMRAACSSITGENIVPIDNQADYDQFVELLNSCVDITKMIEESRNFDEVQKLADCMETYKGLKSKIQEKYICLKELRAQITHDVLKKMSDVLAEKSLIKNDNN